MTSTPNSIARAARPCNSFEEYAALKRLTPAQKAVVSLTPIFEACRKKALPITPDNCEARARAVNRYLDFRPHDWIRTFKDLVHDPEAIRVVAEGIRAGKIYW